MNPRLGFVFQRDATFPWKTVAQNVGLPLLFRGVDSLVSRDGVARVIETMRAFDVVPAGMKFEPESVYDNRFVLKALGR